MHSLVAEQVKFTLVVSWRLILFHYLKKKNYFCSGLLYVYVCLTLHMSRSEDNLPEWVLLLSGFYGLHCQAWWHVYLPTLHLIGPVCHTFLFYVYKYFAYNMWCVGAWCLSTLRESVKTPRAGVKSRLWATVWVLGIKPGQSAGAASALNCWAVNPKFLIFKCENWLTFLIKLYLLNYFLLNYIYCL